MAKVGQRKCQFCGLYFVPDHRKGALQRYCCALECRRASKAANRDYFSGPVHVARVRAWRSAHPGYSRGKPRPSPALQDLLMTQVPDAVEESVNRGAAVEPVATRALQDLWNTESPLLTGLVAHLFELSLQDEMVSTTRRLVQLGNDMINGKHGDGSQAGSSARATSPGAQAVQLG